MAIYLIYLFIFSSSLAVLPLLGMEKEPAASHPENHKPISQLPAEVKENPSPRTSMTGDWNGVRSKLEDDGVNISASYVDEFLGNPIGGIKKGVANAATFEIDCLFDLEKMGHFRGLSAITSFVYRFGTNLSAKAIGNQFNVAEVYGGETYRLNELYLKESFSHDVCTVKAGRMNTGRDFIASPIYAQFVSLAFQSNPVAILFNAPFLEDPFATWAAYLDFKPHRALLLKFAVYNNNKEIIKNKYHGVGFTFHSTDGVLVISEGDFLANQQPASHGMAGNYKVGWYYSTGHVPKFKGGTQRGDFGYYFAFDQMIYRNGGAGTTQGLTIFGAFLFAPKNRNLFPFYFDAGLIYKGVIPSRPEDCLAFGVGYGAYSSDLRHVERVAKMTGAFSSFGNQPQTSETLLELNYGIQINKWLNITPDMQYIINPRGLGTIKDAYVIGLQLSVII